MDVIYLGVQIPCKLVFHKVLPTLANPAHRWCACPMNTDEMGGNF